MLEQFLLTLRNLPKELIVFFVAALPISELRGAIPLGFTFHFSWQKVFLLSILGNLLPVPFLLGLLEPLSGRLRKFRLWSKFFDWLFERTKKKAKTIERYEFWGLVMFVGIPLPMTGAWTGAIAASLFKLRFRRALFAISIGVVIAAILVTVLVFSGHLIVSLSNK